ncbi:diguanylate cyclase [Rhodococcus ruber]|uniref:Diguanylate cyclase n=1 Tax=Rhodococcus ruber TaxID=1830 RepID=A0ABT4MBA6_9NOCA|nr:sensor domain-containing diguanylate cyclase [Rhodococcus ruber]MCZ4517810.1 diguanylate cyclase [Rhodococcus ruber]
MVDAPHPSFGAEPLVSDTAFHAASVGITRFHIGTSYLEWDTRAAAIFDAGHDDRPAIDIWRSRVHPHDTSVLRTLYGDARTSIGAECIYRIIDRDNNIRHVLTRSVAIEHDPDGRPSVLTGVVSLVEPPPEPQVHLMPAVRWGRILDGVSLGFAIVDKAMVLQYINTQTERHLGVSREEVVGRHMHEALPETAGSYFDDLHRDAIATRGEVTRVVQALFLPGRTLEVTANYVESVVAISFRDVTDFAATTSSLLEAYRELLIKSRVDDLTGVLNRAALLERIERMTAETAAPAAVLFIDLDDFKGINDTYGHLAGDRVLRITAARLVAICDSGTVFGRIGGDEFVAALFDDTLLGPTRSAADIEREMIIAASPPIDIVDAHVSVSISIGIAHNTGASTLEEMLTQADRALYRAKQTGSSDRTDIPPFSP